MGNLKKRISKSLAVLLAVALAVTNVNVTIFAAETQNSRNIAKSSTKSAEKTRKGEQESAASGSAVSVEKSKLEKLQKRIDALPTVSEFKAMADGTTVEGSKFSQKQMDVYNEAQDISDEIDKLSDKEQAQVDTAKLEKLFEYFNEQVSTSDNGWSVSKKGVLTITSAGVVEQDYEAYGMPWSGERKNIKEVVINCNPTKLGAWTFGFCINLTSITIPNSVTTIKNNALNTCKSLASVTIPNSVTTIEEKAFYSCDSLLSVTIPNKLTTIGKMVFSFCGLTSVVIPNSVTTIGEGAFYYCNSLTSIVIPNSVATIEDGAFACCYALTSIVIPNSVTTIGESAFAVCSSLKSITLPSGLTTIGSYVFSRCTSLTNIIIPNGVTTIGSYAFESCSSLKSITLPSRLTTIGSYVFSRCTSLTNIIIPNGVTTIGSYAFESCSSLKSITLPSRLTTIGSYAFKSAGIKKVYILGNPTIYNLGSPDKGSATVYYKSDATNVDKYVSGTSDYTKGEFIELNFTQQSQNTNYGNYEVSYTATVADGLISVLDNKNINVVSVTGKDKDSGVSVETSAIEYEISKNSEQEFIIKLKTTTKLNAGSYDFDVNLEGNGTFDG